MHPAKAVTVRQAPAFRNLTRDALTFACHPTGSLKMWTDSLEADSGGPGRLPGPEPDKETTLWSNRARALALSTQLLISDVATIVALVGQCPTGLRRSG